MLQSSQRSGKHDLVNDAVLNSLGSNNSRRRVTMTKRAENHRSQQPASMLIPLKPYRILLAAAIVSFALPFLGKAAVLTGDTPMLPGGLPAIPVITNTVTSTQQMTIKWHGLSAPYSVEQSSLGTSTNWTTVASGINSRSFTTPATNPHSFYRIKGNSPNYAGSDTCFICHDVWDEWSQTKHSIAMSALQSAHSDKNPNCVACHSVGFGLPTGYNLDTNSANFQMFANVQCENCHGPAGNHAINPGDVASRPLIVQSGHSLRQLPYRSASSKL